MRLQDYCTSQVDPDETLPSGQKDPEETLDPNEVDPEETLATGGRVEGNSAAYWERMARQVVVGTLLRAARNIDAKSIAGKLARDRLVGLAEAEDPQLAAEDIKAHEDWQHNLLMRLRCG